MGLLKNVLRDVARAEINKKTVGLDEISDYVVKNSV